MFSNFIIRYNTCKSRQWKFLNSVLQLESIEEYYISNWIINLPICDIYLDSFSWIFFFFFLKTDSTELFRAFELRASIRISQKKKSRNNSIIQQSIFFLLLLQCTCKSETMGGCKVTIPVSRGTRLSFQSDTCLRDRCLSALASVTSSSRPCFPIDTPRHIMVALYKPHDTVQPLSSSDKQAHPCRGRASSLRHLSNLFHRMTGDRLKRKKKHSV